jgi:branched-chain amino acid transport system permease protein
MTGATAPARLDDGDRRPAWTSLLPALVILIAGLLPLVAGHGVAAYALNVGARMMVFAIAALSLDLILGYGGMVSFGHAAFIGIGTYVAGILDAEGMGDLLIGLPVAVAVSACFALVTGYIAIRTKGAAFLMITLAFGQMAFFIANSLDEFGGSDGLTLTGRATVAGAPLIASDLAFYYVVLVGLSLAFLFLRALVASRFGRVLRAAREDPTRVAALGYDVLRVRLTAYVIAGAICGIAGYLLGNQTQFVSPADMTWQSSGELMFMVILGGKGTLYGPLLGAIVITGLKDVLSGYWDHWPLVLGILYLAAALLARGGLARLPRRGQAHG